MDFSLFDQLQNPVLVLDRDLKVSYFNHICGTYFKMPPRKLKKSEKLEDLIQTKQVNLSALAKDALKQGASKVTQEIGVLAGENEREAAIILKFIPVGDQNIVVHVMDFSIEKQLHEKYKKQILELKETHEQIVRSDKLTALGELISGISHEIATPLTIVSERLGRMENALFVKDWERLSEAVPEVQKEFLRITQIISGMQSYARNQEDELQVCNLKSIVDESAHFIKELNILGKIELEIKADGDHLAMANPLKLQQVIINLIKNSVDALKEIEKEDKKITVVIEENDHEQIHTLKVADNGPGVAPELRDSVFEMFYTSKEIGEG
ncbi:MAG: ATP-binding protein, partial [Bacteriovoracaceae bacterium]